MFAHVWLIRYPLVRKSLSHMRSMQQLWPADQHSSDLSTLRTPRFMLWVFAKLYIANAVLQNIACWDQSITYIREATSFTIQSIPVNRFSPVIAEQDCICQWCDLIESRSSPCLISSFVMAPLRSCLFAKTSKVAPASFSSFNNPDSSVAQSLIRSLSPLSTTHTTASVCSK